VVAVITKIRSHPQRATDHAFDDSVAFLSADAGTTAIGAPISVIESQRKPGKENGVSLGAHAWTSGHLAGQNSQDTVVPRRRGV